MESKTIVLVLLPMISAILSSYLTYFYTIKKSKNESIRKFKEEKYLNLIIALKGFTGNSAIDNNNKRKFLTEFYKCQLYGSDNVVKSINNLINFFKENKRNEIDPKTGEKLIGSIILEMRKDLYGKTKLKYSEFQFTNVN